MRLCIVYDTRREHGATKRIVEWMAEEAGRMGVQVDVRRPWEVEDFNYDFFIVGSPVYWEKPMATIIGFLADHSGELAGRKVAVFIVCLANVFGKLTSGYVKKKYLDPLIRRVSGVLVASTALKGWVRKADAKQEENCRKWVRKVIEEAST